MDQLGNLIIEDREIENERFEVVDKNKHYFLGPNLTLRHCTVILKVPASHLFINQACFIDCMLEVKLELKNFQQWIRAQLKGCRFKGRLVGCDFGHWPGYGSAPEYQYGSIEDCDFSEAHLNACRFIDCDPLTLRLPRWPYFTILDPIGRAAELREGRWPSLFGRVLIADLHNDPPATAAATFHAPTIAKQLETTPEELRAVIETFDCILF